MKNGGEGMPITNGIYTDTGAFMMNEEHSLYDSKQNHDRYDVYVNGEFVGHKTLLTQSESINDVNDFLQAQGFRQVDGKLDGDHYDIHVEGEDSSHVKEALHIYLQSR